MMNTRFLLIVGDKFAAFAAQRCVLTLSQLRGLLTLPAEFALKLDHVRLVPGQGLSDADLAEISATVRASAYHSKIDLTHWATDVNRAPARLSHKQEPRNTVISTPRQIADSEYEVDLLLEENCDLMGDHQTGLHLQGMIAIEAARQSAIAIAEKFVLPSEQRYYFVFDNISITYKRFLFPISAKLRCSLKILESSSSGFRMILSMTFSQADCEAAEVAFGYSAFRERIMVRKEAALATDAIERHFTSIDSGTAIFVAATVQ